ncbi:MAG: hypothetical protein QM504_17985 [Pseudomonadota bacterium]
MQNRTKKVKKRAGKVIHSAITKHAIEKANEIRARYGPVIDYSVILNILEDRKCIRYPVEVKFISDGIEPDLFANTESISDNPADGYVISIHRHFENQTDILPALILYQSVLVNYGDLATAIDAEFFGSTVLGIDRDSYYEQIISLTDSLWQ